MIYRLVIKVGIQDDISYYLNTQTMYLMNYYMIYRKYPTPTDLFQDTVDIEMENIVEDYETSYMNLREFLDKDLENVTKCVWSLRADEEEFLYEYDATVKAGEGIEIRTENHFGAYIGKNSR